MRDPGGHILATTTAEPLTSAKAADALAAGAAASSITASAQAPARRPQAPAVDILSRQVLGLLEVMQGHKPSAIRVDTEYCAVATIAATAGRAVEGVAR